MPTGPAGADDDSLGGCDTVHDVHKSSQAYKILGRVDAAPHAILEDHGLLHDLFHHKVFVTPFLDGRDRHGDLLFW